MATLHARGVSFAYGPATVLRDVELVVAPGQRIGIVGPNGSGKSTLLRVLTGELRPDQGSVSTAPPAATVGLLPQEPDRLADETVADFVARRTGVGPSAVELDAATAALAAGEPAADDRYAGALDRWLGLGGPDLDARIGRILDELGLDGAVAGQATATLSGGQAARVSLAATLLARFDVFLLDEPTNDLDFDGLERLERFLVGLGDPTVVVSHDRAFLARVVTHVLELDEHDHRGRLYAGGWEAHLADRATARRHAEEAYDTYQDKRAALTERSRTQREWSSKGIGKAKRSGETDKFIRHRAKVSSEKLAHKAKATERAMERLDVVDKPWEGWEHHLDLVAIEQLESALDRYLGTLLLVTHDRRFLDRVRVTRQLAVANGRVTGVP
jgi:ATPase subunit of ABC transporter with duplicated ATPase domains